MWLECFSIITINKIWRYTVSNTLLNNSLVTVDIIYFQSQQEMFEHEPVYKQHPNQNIV